MKKFVFAFAILVSLFAISCRQDDEMLSNQDITNLKIINSKTNIGGNVTVGGTITSRDEVVKPPK